MNGEIKGCPDIKAPYYTCESPEKGISLVPSLAGVAQALFDLRGLV